MTRRPEKRATPARKPAPEPQQVCANCGSRAEFRTTNPGANVDHYCAACGRESYPGPGLERIR